MKKIEFIESYLVPEDGGDYMWNDNHGRLIRCKDCKHYLDSNEKCDLIDTRLNFYATDKRWNGDSFCSWAERRGDPE